MSATNIEQTFSADCLEVSFSRAYTLKAFTTDALKLKDLVRKHGREKLSEDEVIEVAELRRKLRRADADAVLLTVIKTRQAGGLLFF